MGFWTTLAGIGEAAGGVGLGALTGWTGAGAIGAGALIGGGAGLVKSGTLDDAVSRKQAQMASEQTRYSPWTGMAPGKVTPINPGDAMLQGSAAGAGMVQSAHKQDLAEQTMQWYKDHPWAGPGMAAAAQTAGAGGAPQMNPLYSGWAGMNPSYPGAGWGSATG